MTTLDDLARVERELRCMADALGYSAGDWIRGNAGTIAEYIAAQRGRDADNAKLRAELAAAKAEVEQSDAEYQDAVTLAKSNLDRFHAAQAACGQMREALAGCTEFLSLWKDHDDDALRAYKAANRTLSTDAGRNYVGASGAVEATVARFPAFDAAKTMMQVEVPDEWAGATVLVMRKP